MMWLKGRGRISISAQSLGSVASEPNTSGVHSVAITVGIVALCAVEMMVTVWTASQNLSMMFLRGGRMFNKLLSWFRPTRGTPAPIRTNMDHHIQALMGGDVVKRHIGEQTCPACHCRVNAGATIHGVQRAKPHPSDLGLCYHCGAVLEFDRDFKLRLVTDESWGKLPRDIQEEIVKAQGQATLPGLASKSRRMGVEDE